ncbi:unnamed protein product [Arabis nemorensis]|uniref:Uncharacterized protein n=1 Tax=Arabis nemorensis TaxID=586526 RepID=A0A565BDV9_9BRAS|nr:unnamed protein product [Arabis nemorensis]
MWEQNDNEDGKSRRGGESGGIGGSGGTVVREGPTAPKRTKLGGEKDVLPDLLQTTARELKAHTS